MPRILLLNKPYNVLCQFTDTEGRRTLAEITSEKGLYPAGRLDRDSEGMVLLTDDGSLQHCIAHPRHKMPKTYWIQVEGEPDEVALQQLRKGVVLKDGITQPAVVKRIEEPAIWLRDPPIRYRAKIPTSWLSLTITEGRNRQVRRMTAAVGFPTLRLIRWAIGPWQLNTLLPGQLRELTDAEVDALTERCTQFRPNRPAQPAQSRSNISRRHTKPGKRKR